MESHLLNLVYPPRSVFKQVAPYQVEVSTRLIEGGILEANFQVRSDFSPYVNPKLHLEYSQWGLWEWDVVELFVSCSGDADIRPLNCPYYEFQLSPLGQFFELKVFEPRKKMDQSFKSGFSHSVERFEKGNWNAQMKIALEPLGWDRRPESVVGNAFAILGESPQRTYWSRYLDSQVKPDFHLPSEFMRLVD